MNLVCFVDQDGGLRIHSRDAVGELLDLGLEAASAAGLQISRDDQVIILRDEAYHTVIESTVAKHVATAHEPPVHARLHHRGHSLPRELCEAARGWYLCLFNVIRLERCVVRLAGAERSGEPKGVKRCAARMQLYVPELYDMPHTMRPPPTTQ